MLALSIRQPFVELILRGMKTVEYRTRSTRIVEERFYLYAGRQPAAGWPALGTAAREPAKSAPNPSTRGAASRKYDVMTGSRGSKAPLSSGIWSADLLTVSELPWIAELAQALRLFPRDLQTGLIVGSAVIDRVTQSEGQRFFHWHLKDVERLAHPLKPERHPQPVWFRPF